MGFIDHFLWLFGNKSIFAFILFYLKVFVMKQMYLITIVWPLKSQDRWPVGKINFAELKTLFLNMTSITHFNCFHYFFVHWIFSSITIFKLINLHNPLSTIKTSKMPPWRTVDWFAELLMQVHRFYCFVFLPTGISKIISFLLLFPNRCQVHQILILNILLHFHLFRCCFK